MKGNKPAYREFQQLVKRSLSRHLSDLDEGQLEHYLNENDSIDVIQHEYEHSSKLFDEGVITEQIFRNGSVSAAAYTLFLLY